MRKLNESKANKIDEQWIDALDRAFKCDTYMQYRNEIRQFPVHLNPLIQGAYRCEGIDPAKYGAYTFSLHFLMVDGIMLYGTLEAYMGRELVKSVRMGVGMVMSDRVSDSIKYITDRIKERLFFGA